MDKPFHLRYNGKKEQRKDRMDKGSKSGTIFCELGWVSSPVLTSNLNRVQELYLCLCSPRSIHCSSPPPRYYISLSCRISHSSPVDKGFKNIWRTFLDQTKDPQGQHPVLYRGHSDASRNKSEWAQRHQPFLEILCTPATAIQWNIVSEHWCSI